MLEWLFGTKKSQEKPKKKKQKKEQEAEDKWMYQFLLQFLTSPIWQVSIMDFVDANCIIFDNQQENKFEYTTIHEKFKQLVGTLFDNMMQEIGLSNQKLLDLLEQGFQSQKDRKIFNQLLLCDDFLRFKKFMLTRNKTLEKQAAKALLETQSGKPHRPSQLEISKQKLLQSQQAEKKRLEDLQKQEDEMLRKALEMSRQEAEQIQKISKLEENAYDRKSQEKLEKQITETQAKKQNARHSKVVEQKLAPLKQPAKIKKKNDFPEEDTEKCSGQPAGKNVQVEEKNHYQAQAEEKQVQPQQDRRKRLREQREKLRQKKEEERKKNLTQEKTFVQRIVLQDADDHDKQAEQPIQKKISNDEIQRRRELMKKIQNRIVDDF